MVENAKAFLVENKVLIDDSTLKGLLVEKGFGENKGRNLILDLFETLYLVERDKLTLLDKNGKVIPQKKILSIGAERDKYFYSKFIVYSDIREKGYCIKTGLKFGFDFRVYPKGKKMGEEHSQFVINVCPESEKLSMTHLSRMTRLAGSTHTKLLQAVVDREDSVNYYLLGRELL
ncbi:MAG: tRNA-intron lyase [archaeon]